MNLINEKIIKAIFLSLVCIFLFLIFIDFICYFYDVINNTNNIIVKNIINILFFLEDFLIFILVGFIIYKLNEILLKIINKFHNFKIQLLSFILLIILLLVEIIYLIKSPWLGISSKYKALFPMLFSGFLFAFVFLSSISQKILLEIKFSMIHISFILYILIFGPFIVDFLYLTEGTDRGSGLIWQIPIIGSFLSGFTYILLIYPVVVFIIISSFVIFIFFFLYKKIKKRENLNIKEFIISLFSILILMLSLIFLLPMWANFIAD